MNTVANGSKFLSVMRGRLAKVHDRAAPAALAEGSRILAAEIGSRAPRRTGRLAASAHALAVRRAGWRLSAGAEVTGGHETPMVAAVEFGNEHQAAEPFIRPGADAATSRVRRILGRALKSL